MFVVVVVVVIVVAVVVTTSSNQTVQSAVSVAEDCLCRSSQRGDRLLNLLLLLLLLHLLSADSGTCQSL